MQNLNRFVNKLGNSRLLYEDYGLREMLVGQNLGGGGVRKRENLKEKCYNPHHYDPNYETSITAKSEPHG